MVTEFERCLQIIIPWLLWGYNILPNGKAKDRYWSTMRHDSYLFPINVKMTGGWFRKFWQLDFARAKASKQTEKYLYTLRLWKPALGDIAARAWMGVCEWLATSSLWIGQIPCPQYKSQELDLYSCLVNRTTPAGPAQNILLPLVNSKPINCLGKNGTCYLPSPHESSVAILGT